MEVKRIELLKEYIQSNIAPILTDDKYISLLPNRVEIDTNNLEKELEVSLDENGKEHAPTWFEDVERLKLLVVRNIDLLSKEKQRKLIEILKYKKISTLHINPKGIIILTYQNLDFNKFDEEIISLTIQAI